MTIAFPPRAVAVLAWLLCVGFPTGSRAETVTLFPIADATLIELRPSNSFGAGNWISSGTTQEGHSNRALIKFDVAAAVPTGSTVTDVGLYVTATRNGIDGNASSMFSLRRMLRPWGEGTNLPPLISPGFGFPAQPGDATWTHSFWGTNAWTVPGGLEGVDYSENISTATSIPIARIQPYFFESGGMIGDVQFWIEHPESNFGWMLKSEDEASIFTARRFGSRELQDPGESPQLVITFSPPPHIDMIRVASNHVTLSFNIEIGYFYAVETRGTISGTNSWTVLTNYGLVLSPGPLMATDTITNSQRVYRVRRD